MRSYTMTSHEMASYKTTSYRKTSRGVASHSINSCSTPSCGGVASSLPGYSVLMGALFGCTGCTQSWILVRSFPLSQSTSKLMTAFGAIERASGEG